MGFYDNLLGDRSEAGKRRIDGVVPAVVTENWDDKHIGMVKVEVALAGEGKNLTTWVRVARPYAGKNYGFYMLPEVGDEVLVSFNMGDPDQAYVIGSLWNSVDTIPENTAVEENTIKRLTTKGGHEVIFDEEKDKANILVRTPGGLSLKIEDEKPKITLCDADGKNLLIINADEGTVTVTAEKKIVLDAGGASTLTLDGQGKKAELKADAITIEAGQALTLKGQSFKGEGSAGMELKSGATLKGEASAMMELKGAMVKIN